ncbi:A-kinase anchor protein 8-like isoform X2 [Periophthalmus magnuspinnatus]|uniref:A-kinase anchor protein 8-like isoform X2 n=1 Tax=Periophthalmus magnuspinnatus TaxID=409849 RepID=UPI00145AEAA5|nr:A-kinase anchor protein 8-like isoform X2 [Periophthalmus magnuspinnatus]
MDSRGYGSGYSSWGGGGPSSRGSHADDVIAKINERLDMLSQLEGGVKGDRYDQYESMDSRSSLASSRDLYRSGSYGYGDGRGDNMLLTHRGGSGYGGGMGMGSGASFDDYSSYGVAKMRPNMREPFSGGQGASSGGWASANRHSPRRGGNTGGFGGHRGHRGQSPGGGRGKLPSLLSNRMYPESGGFHQGPSQGPSQGPHDFPGRHFGGGPRAGRQRGRKRPLNKVKQQPQKKKRQNAEGDEPESKINKTESTGDAASAGDAPETQDKNGHGDESKASEDVSATETTEKAEPKGEDGGQGSKAQSKQTPAAQSNHQRMRKRRGFIERVMFTCSVCKFRSFYKEDMEAHLTSRFHKDHFKFLQSQLSKPTTDFLQEYLQNKLRKTEFRVGQLENHSASICQVYREQDLTRDLGLEHFIRKVEAAHCAACDLFIPMQNHLIQKHLKSPDHNYNRKAMMEQSKRASLSVARSILNHKVIGKKLESYLKGENPFFDNPDEQEPDDSMAMDVSGTELTGEQADSQPLEGLTPSDALEEAPLSLEVEGATEVSLQEGAEAVTGASLVKEDHVGQAEVAEFHPEDEGFELGDEECSFVVHDELPEGLDLQEELPAEEEEQPAEGAEQPAD